MVKCDVIYLSTLLTDINLFGFIIFETSRDKTQRQAEWETDGCIRESNTENEDVLRLEPKDFKRISLLLKVKTSIWIPSGVKSFKLGLF